MSSENNEERNLSEEMRYERFAAMEQVVTQLYCRHVFHDFRKPVEVMYPHLTEAYHSLVKRPMDLGTLLLKTLKKEILTIEEFRTNLQLVHNNALLFNEGAPLMEAISNHLRLFSQGLFEEIMRFPYYTPKTTKPVNFQSVRLEKRRKRFLLIRDQALLNSELESLMDILDGGSSLASPSIRQACSDAHAMVAEQLAWSKAADISDLELSAQCGGLSLRTVLSPIILAATLPGSDIANTQSQALLQSFCDTQCEEKLAYGEFRLPRAESRPYLAVLEERLGELGVLVEERLLRGTPSSSIWATPASMYVYAQSISSTATSSEGRSRSPWWPCQIIATDATTCGAFYTSEGVANGTSNALGMRPEIQRSNLARIPADILKGLIKLKPRTANVVAAIAGEGEPSGAGEMRANSGTMESPAGTRVVSASAQFVVPEGYLLLEYFGEHDFGWVKAESVTPMYTYTPTADGGVYISKNEAPGRLCHKDVVAEAAEAWSTLQKQRRRDGLYRRSLLPPPSFLASTTGSVEVAIEGSGSAMSVVSDGTLGGSAEEEGISFAPVVSLTARSSLQGGSSSAASEYLSQDSDTEAADQQDLPALPSIGELEESVDIPFSSTIFENNASQMGGMIPSEMGHNGGAGPSNTSSAAKSSSSRASNGRSRKSQGSSQNTDTNNYFDDASSGAVGGHPFCVPGARRGSFTAAQNGAYNPSFDWEDRRIMYASPEDLLQYRANVEYVLLEDVTVEDFKNCVVEGKFKPSRCPLPLPTLQSQSSSPVKASASDNKELKDELIIVDPATQATFRPKALLRTRALAFFLSNLRPLHLEHYSATPSKKGFPALPSSGSRSSLKVSAANESGDLSDAAVLLASEDAPLLLLTEEKKGSNNNNKAANGDAIALPVKPEKRKYVFKNKPAKVTAVAAASPAQDIPSEQQAGESATTAPSSGSSSVPTASTAPAAATETAASTTTAATAALPPISAANIHVPANLTLSSSCFLLDAGCSRYAAGDGSVYTRAVNTDAKVFHQEAKRCKDRKRILREELSSLQAAIDALQQVSQQRQLRENERKIRFQQLQQQQLQQQLHQQQYAVQVQQQHQQYLMQLIQQQQQQQQLQNRLPHPAGGAVGSAMKKSGPPKPKAVKASVPAAQGGVPGVPKPRSRPMVVFNAAGQPTIVRSSAAPSAAGATTAASAAAAATSAAAVVVAGANVDGSGNVSSSSEASDAAGGAVPPSTQYAVPVPRKKSRLGDIDLSKATILTAQQHAAEQPKHPQKRAKVKLTLPAKSTTSNGGAEESGAALLGAHPLNTPQATTTTTSSGSAGSVTHALDFLASVAMESNDAPVRDGRSNPSHNEDLLGYKRSFGAISSPPAQINDSTAELIKNDNASSTEAMSY